MDFADLDIEIITTATGRDVELVVRRVYGDEDEDSASF
jgi:hypothetical protein